MGSGDQAVIVRICNKVYEFITLDWIGSGPFDPQILDYSTVYDTHTPASDGVLREFWEHVGFEAF